MNSKFPYHSSTKIAPFVDKFIFNNHDFYNKYTSKNFISKFELLNSATPIEKKVAFTIDAIQDHIDKINIIRNTYQYGFKGYARAVNILEQLKHTHMGNCSETAKASEIMLKANGIINSYTATLTYAGSAIDHEVCLFNRNGKPFTKIINNQTILIDPWADIADFANNAFKIYKTRFKKQFNLKGDEKLGVTYIQNCNIRPDEIEKLKLKFPELIQKRSST